MKKLVFLVPFLVPFSLNFCSYVESEISQEQLASSAIVYLQGQDGEPIALPYHFLTKLFQKKIKVLSKGIKDSKIVIDCALFFRSTLKLISEILIYEAGRAFAQKSNPFPLSRIQYFLQDTDKSIVIQKAQNMLRALKFFHVSDDHFEAIFKECIRITGCEKKELFYSQEDLIEKLKRENLYSLNSKESEYREKESASTNDLNYMQEELYKQLHLSPKAKRGIAFDLIKKQVHKDPSIPVVSPYIIDSTSWRDLEIFCGSGSSKDIYPAASIDCTSSEIGKALLYSKLLQPTDSIAEIEKHKKILTLLIDNPEVFENLDRIFTDFFKEPKWENGLLSFFNDRRDYFEERMKMFSVPDFLPQNLVQWLNGNEVAQSTWNAKDRISLWIKDVITKPVDKIHKRLPTLTNPIATLEKASHYLPLILWVTDKAIERTPALSIELPSWLTGTATALGNIVTYIPKDMLYKLNPYKMALKIAAVIVTQAPVLRDLPEYVKIYLSNELTTILCDFIANMTNKNVKESIEAELDIINCLYERLFILAHYVKTIDQVNEQLKKVPELQELLPFLKALDLEKDSTTNFFTYFVRESVDPASFNQFMNKLNSTIFEKHDTSWSKTRFGRIISASYVIHLHKEKLFETFMAMAELDVYLSLARLYNKNKGTSHPYCFVEPIESKNPIINLEEVWNPTKNEAVPNTITLGIGQNPKDAIITGPNMGGKSTLLRSIVFALLMTKMGLCPAKKAVITPFSNIRAYLNITDDMAHELSLFRVSTKRANELLKVADKPHSRGPSFIIFDEPYSGTKPQAGESLAYGTLKNLNEASDFPRNICIASTHYPFVQQVREELDTNFAFLRVCDSNSDIEENRYKVVPGIYTGFNALEVAEDAKILPKIMSYSRSYLKNLKNRSLNGYELYLDELNHKSSFDRFINRLNQQEEETVEFFHTMGLMVPYCYILLQIALDHNYDISKLINHQDTAGRTLLHYIALRDIKNTNLIRFLIEKGADIEIKDIKGCRPIDYAF